MVPRRLAAEDEDEVEAEVVAVTGSMRKRSLL
jgi:hypothetical protein